MDRAAHRLPDRTSCIFFSESLPCSYSLTVSVLLLTGLIIIALSASEAAVRAALVTPILIVHPVSGVVANAARALLTIVESHPLEYSDIVPVIVHAVVPLNCTEVE